VSQHVHGHDKLKQHNCTSTSMTRSQGGLEMNENEMKTNEKKRTTSRAKTAIATREQCAGFSGDIETKAR